MTTKLTPRQAARIGARFKAAREERGETLQAISRQSGVNYTQLSRFERGVFKTRSKNVQKVANYLQIPSAVDARSEAPHPELGERTLRVAALSPKNQRLIEAVLDALDGP